MIDNRKSRRAAARQAGSNTNKRKALTAVATSGLLVSPMLSSTANATELAGPVVTECSTGTGAGSHHNLGWAIDQINNGNGEGLNYGPIGTTITFDLNAPCTLDFTGGDTYTIAENMNIQGPGEDNLTLRVAFSEGSGLGMFKIDANAFSPTLTTSLDVTLHGMTIDGGNVYNDQPLISGSDVLGPLTLELDHVTVKNANGNGSAVLYLGNNNGSEDDSSLSISGSTFESNTGYSAIFVDGGPVTISKSTIKDNVSGSFPAAIFTPGSALTISDSTVSNNNGSMTGAVIAESMTISGSTFDSNHGNGGPGAIQGYQASTITTSTFVNNYSEGGSGGAVYSQGDLTVDRSTFLDNTSDYDSGAVQVAGQIIAVNNTFFNNRALNGSGGAILSEGGSIQSNTFVDNSADSEGSTIYTPSSVTLYANVISHEAETSNGCFGTIIDAGANLVTDQCGETAFPAYAAGTRDVSATVTPEQLALKDIALNKKSPSNSGSTKTIALSANSVARDYYSDGPMLQTVCVIDDCSIYQRPSLDQRGVTRPQGARNDVGAFEFGTDKASCVPVNISAVLFKGNSAKLTKKARAALLKDVKKIKSSGCHTVVLNGYTAKVSDGAAHKAFRKLLSKKRNAAVKKYLKKQFTAANYSVTFETHALGAADPTGSNKSAKGRKMNRRVEIVIKKLRNLSI